MGLGWNWTGWQRAAAAAQRRFDATRPHISGLRDWLNTGWTQPDGSPADDMLDAFDAPPPPRGPQAATRPGSDHAPRETRP